MGPSKTSKVVLVIIGILVLIVFIYLGYIITKGQKESNNIEVLPSVNKSKLSSPTNSASISPSANLSPTPSPTSSVSIKDLYKIPDGEAFVISSKADSNGDKNDETLVITEKADKKIHAYVLSSKDEVLFDIADLGQKPVRIETPKYGEKENFVSWMLIFTEDSGNLAFIHWNGTKYEIPQENLDI